MHLLHRVGGLSAQNELWGFIADGLILISLPIADEWRQMQALMNQYADMPLDLADASLIAAASRVHDWGLFSIDSRLRAVRLPGQRSFNVVP